MSQFLLANQTVRGCAGLATATIDGKLIPMFEIKSIKTRMEKNKVEFKTVGTCGMQHKATGWKGTGEMTIREVTSIWKEMAQHYIKTGRDIYFSITINNADTAVPLLGVQSITYERVNIDGMDMSMLDADSEFLESSMTFTWEDIEINTTYTELLGRTSLGLSALSGILP